MPETLTIELRESGGSRPGQDYQPPPPPAYTPPAPPAPAMPPSGQPTVGPATQPVPAAQQANPAPTNAANVGQTVQTNAANVGQTVQGQVVSPPPPPRAAAPPPFDVNAEAERKAKERIQQQELAQLTKKKMDELVPTLEEFKPPPTPGQKVVEAGEKGAEASKLLGNLGQPGLEGFANKMAGGVKGAGMAMDGAGLAAANPIAAAALALKQAAEEGARASIRAVGEVATKVASLDTNVFAEQFEKAADKTNIFGIAAAETSRQLRSFDGALADLSKKFAQYSGPLALAEAMGDVSQILGDVKRAKKLEDAGLAEVTNARNKASQAAQDALVAILTPAIPVMIALLEQIAEVAVRTEKTIDGVTQLLPTYFELVKAGFSLDIEKVGSLQAKLIMQVEDIKRRMIRAEEKKDEPDFISSLFDGRPPAIPGAIAPPRFPDFPMR